MIASAGHLLIVGGRLVLVLVAIRAAFAAWRICPRSRAAWRHLPAALWARLRWRWLARNLGLAYLDLHRRASRRPSVPFGTSVRVKAPAPGGPAKLRYPRARITADDYGIFARVRTIPRVGRAEFDDNAEHIANAWRCHRVQVRQPRPGRVELRGIRRDPLLEPLDHAGDWLDGPPRVLRLGLDEFGTWRSLPLGRNVTGVVVSGLPGTAKTSLITAWLGDFAGTPAAQFVIIDGKSPDGVTGDYADWADRAVILTGDELPGAIDAAEFAHDQMRSRLGNVRAVTGYRNAWAGGHPSRLWPLLFVLVDEAATFCDVAHFKGDRRAEEQSRRMTGLLSQLIRRGGSVCILVVLISQKVTGDAIPTILRDNSALALSFALKTTEASVAALGESIRKYPAYDPTTLQAPEYVGVCTASLRTGLMPYVRLRVPRLDETSAADRAAVTAHNRRDPLPPAEIPAAPGQAEPAEVPAPPAAPALTRV